MAVLGVRVVAAPQGRLAVQPVVRASIPPRTPQAATQRAAQPTDREQRREPPALRLRATLVQVVVVPDHLALAAQRPLVALVAQARSTSGWWRDDDGLPNP